MFSRDSDMVEYKTATMLASVYESAAPKIVDAIRTIYEETERLQKAFDSSYRFSIRVYFDGRQWYSDEATERAEKSMRCDAWSAIIEKLGIRNLMSSARVQQLDDALQGKSDEQLPEITEDAILDVLEGMIDSAETFMQEAIHEEYDFWKPSTNYKRNSEFQLQPRIIRPSMVEPGYSGGFRINYMRRQHIIALDNIFHLLDGKGMVKGYSGPLADEIETSKDGRGETEYFRFRCCKNGNLHLEFKRKDLLDKFNQIAGRNRLPSAACA